MRDFWTLLATGLTNTISQPIGKCDWNAIEGLAGRHGVLPIVFDGFKTYYERQSLNAPLEVKLRWYAVAQQVEKRYAGHLKEIKSLGEFYAKHGIRMMLLKGYGLSLNYPIPNHRPTGDIDIYLYGDWKKADKLVEEELGIRIDNSHHHHSVFKYKGESVENHFDFINVYDRRTSPCFERLFKEQAEVNPIEILPNVYVPNPTMNALFVAKHIAGHFATTKMSIRQLLDWLLFVKRYHEQIDWDMLYKIFREHRMIHFVNSMNAIGVEYLGFDRYLFPEIETDKTLLNRVYEDMMCPEFKERENGTLLSGLWIKPRRFWHNRWKHRICYKDSFVSAFVYTLYAKLLKPSHFVH